MQTSDNIKIAPFSDKSKLEAVIHAGVNKVGAFLDSSK